MYLVVAIFFIIGTLLAAIVTTPLLLKVFALCKHWKPRMLFYVLRIISILLVPILIASTCTYHYTRGTHIFLQEFPVPHSNWSVRVVDEIPWGLIGPAIQGEDYVTAINSRTGEEVSLMHIKELYEIQLSYEEPNTLVITTQKDNESEIIKEHDVFGEIHVVYKFAQTPPKIDGKKSSR